MKSVLFYSFVVTSVICLFVKHVSSIKCYECKTDLLNGTPDTECRNKYENNKTRECSASVCSVQLVKNKENGERFVIRSCGTETIRTVNGEVLSGKDHGEYDDNGTHVSYRTCATDMCNWDIFHYRTRRDLDEDFRNILANSPVFTVNKDEKTGRNIQCFHCEEILQSKRNCATNMDVIRCNNGACLKIKFSFAGIEGVYRSCYDPQLPFPIDDDFEITSKRVTASFHKCTTDMCNWGIVNEYKMATMIASVMLSLSVYGTFF